MKRFVPYLLLLFLIAAFLRVDFFFTVVYLFLAVYVVPRLWTRHATEQLHAERLFSDRAFAGDQVQMRLIVHNDGWLPVPWVHLHESLPVELSTPPFLREVASLGAYGQRSFTTVLVCRRRGYYEIGPLRLQAGDMLGVISPRRVQMETEALIVYPRVLPLRELNLPTRSPLVALPARVPLFEDPSRIMGVRDYRYGDSPRRIHWTATAGAARLLVKQYEPSIARETLVCLDLTREHYEGRRRYTATELAIVVAASVAHHVVVNEGLPVGLATEGWDLLANALARLFLPPRSERAHLMNLLEVLARIEVAEGTPFPALLRRESVNLPWGATLVVIAGRESEALFDTLVYLRRAGFAVALILVQPTYVSEDLRNRSDMLGMPVHRVWEEPLSFPGL
jgi:uncharacterized protein (DUF58 family)